MSKVILCIGQNCADVIVRGFNKRNAFEKEATYVKNIQIDLGGDATNEACVLAALGNSVKLVYGRSDDNIGEFISHNLEAKGVDISRAVNKSGVPSSINCVVVDEKAERYFLIAEGVPTAEFHLNKSILDGVDILSIGSLFHPPFMDPAETAEFVKAAKKKNIIVCADFCMNSQCRIEDFEEVFRNLDFIFPNMEEAAYYVRGGNIDELAAEYLKMGVSNVVIKKGKDGCSLWNKDGRLDISSFYVPPVDTTGAGDNFAAGFISGLAEGKNLKECCVFATATASLAVQQIGATSGVKSKAAVLDVINSKQGV